MGKESDMINQPKSLGDLLAEATVWADGEFKDATDESRLKHFADEVAELLADPTNGEEMADVVIFVHHLAVHAGVDLRVQVERKLTINRGRVWRKDALSGYSKHVPIE